MSKLLSFATYLGLAPRGAKAEEEGGDGKDKDKAKGGSRADYFDEDPLDEQNAKGKKAKDDDLDEDAEDEELDDDESKDKKAKGKRADDDKKPDSDAEDDDDSAKAVRADRNRSAAIMAYGMQNGCAEQAGELAFFSSMGKSAAIRVLKAGGSHGRTAPAGSLNNRMKSLNVAQVGPEGGAELPAGMSAIAAGIIKAGQ